MHFYGCEGIKELLFPSSMKIISGQHNTNEDAEPQVSTFGMGGTGTAYMSSEAFRGCARFDFRDDSPRELLAWGLGHSRIAVT